MSTTIELVLNLDTVPYHIREGIEQYIRVGRPVGSFLTAVICNDLKIAVMKADDFNLPRLDDIVRFFYNQAPHACWGSKTIMDEWIKIRGWEGYSKTIKVHRISETPIRVESP